MEPVKQREGSLSGLVLKAPLVWSRSCGQETIMLSGLLKEKKRSEVCFVQLVTAYQSSPLPPQPLPCKHISAGTHREMLNGSEQLFRTRVTRQVKTKGWKRTSDRGEERQRCEWIVEVIQISKWASCIKEKSLLSLPFSQVCIPANSGLHSIGFLSGRTKTISFANIHRH